ncbi:DUF29 family protein [Rhizobium rhizogenes]|uniref:DUF29 family protein n=1 Tax=Rhizobium rhizogenes TaxID=359 RepID=UPI001F2C10EC|nr:DUF29 family protein [Rhizobium rhizogenes]
MTYDSDFVTWTRDQATLLRALDPVPTGLDIENLAEEIESLGRREISTISQHLYHLLNNLLLLAVRAPDRSSYLSAAYSAQTEAVFASSPGSTLHVDLDRTYRLARRGAVDLLIELKLDAPDFPVSCPLTVEQLVDEDFDFTGAIKLLEGGNV